MICTAHQILFGDQIKNNEMGVACGTYERQEKCYRVLCGDLRKRDHFEDTGVEGNMILKRFFKK